MACGWDDVQENLSPNTSGQGILAFAPPSTGTHQRGLSQGLAGSVMMAEIHLSLIVYRLAQIQHVDVFAYIDDIHIVSPRIESLKKGLDLIRTFSWDFGLELAAEKSKVWGHDVKKAKDSAEQYGFAYSDVVTAMGADWPLRKSSQPVFGKEQQLIKETIVQLSRLQHVRAKPQVKC